MATRARPTRYSTPARAPSHSIGSSTPSPRPRRRSARAGCRWPTGSWPSSRRAAGRALRQIAKRHLAGDVPRLLEHEDVLVLEEVEIARDRAALPQARGLALRPV